MKPRVRWLILVAFFLAVIVCAGGLVLVGSMGALRESAAPPIRPTTTIVPGPTNVPGLQPTLPGNFNVDQYLKSLAVASYAFNTVDNMQAGVSYMIHLIVSPSEPVQVLVTAVAQPGGKSEGGTVRVDTRMVAHLTGESFHIEPVTPEEQAVSLAERTEWIWQVTPIQKGKQELYLTLSAKIVIEGQETQRQIKTLERNIEVYVTAGQVASNFLQSNWQWLVVTILIPLAGFAVRRFTKKPQRVSPPDHTTGKTDSQ